MHLSSNLLYCTVVIALADGGSDWTIWMPFGWDPKLQERIKTRYKGCHRDPDMKIQCTAELDRIEGKGLPGSTVVRYFGTCISVYVSHFVYL